MYAFIKIELPDTVKDFLTKEFKIITMYLLENKVKIYKFNRKKMRQKIILKMIIIKTILR